MTDDGELEDSGDSPDEVSGDHADPAPIEKFHRTPVGMVLAAGMLGLRDVLETPKDEEPPIVQDWAGGEPVDDPYLVRLDPEHPEDSIVMVRPWLKKKDETTE